MAPPSRIHQEISMSLSTTINNYIQSKKGDCKIYSAPFAVFLLKDETTYIEPDISIICDPNKLTDKGCIGAPDWIIEIASPSNQSFDYIKKLNLYQAAGVREYWIVNPMRKNIFVYFFEETRFEVMMFTFHDKLKVNIYDDLLIDFSDFL